MPIIALCLTLAVLAACVVPAGSRTEIHVMDGKTYKVYSSTKITSKEIFWWVQDITDRDHPQTVLKEHTNPPPRFVQELRDRGQSISDVTEQHMSDE